MDGHERLLRVCGDARVCDRQHSDAARSSEQSQTPTRRVAASKQHQGGSFENTPDPASDVYAFSPIALSQAKTVPDAQALLMTSRRLTAQRIDKVARVLFPLLYSLLNLAYWTVYLI